MYIVGRHAYFQLFVIDPRVNGNNNDIVKITTWTSAAVKIENCELVCNSYIEISENRNVQM